MNRKPNLFIIGSMKAGTSSLAETISSHSNIFLPSIKEPNYFTRTGYFESISESAYLHSYSNRTERWLIDASTQHTKAPWLKVDIKFLREFIDEPIKIIYITRDPYDRFLKHMEHELGNGTFEWEIESLKKFFVTATCISSYEMQLSYWKKEFQEDEILVVQFENLMIHFEFELNRIFGFLGENIEPRSLNELSNENRAGTRRSAHRSILRKVLHSKAYYAIKSYIPAVLRNELRRTFLPVAPVIECKKEDWEEQLVCDAVTRLNSLVCPTEDVVLHSLKDLSEIYAENRISSYKVKVTY